MGLKFYRGSDRPNKIRKRLEQSRSWFRSLKWVACKYTHLILIFTPTNIRIGGFH